jgi:hypothetical protein
VEITRVVGDPALFVQVASASLDIESDEVLMREAVETAGRIGAALPNDEMRQAFATAEPVRKLTALTVAEPILTVAESAPTIAEPVPISPSPRRARRRWWPWGK